MFDEEGFRTTVSEYAKDVLEAASRVETYTEIVIIAIGYVLAYWLANRVRQFSPTLRVPPESPGEAPLRDLLYRFGKLLFPLFAILFLRVSLEFSQLILEESWVMRAALAVAMLLLFNSFVNLVLTDPAISATFRWIGTPILLLHLIGLLDDIVLVLDSISLAVGNIRISAFDFARVTIFGTLLFWLGRISSATGKTIIRRQQSLDLKTREVLAKLFEIALFFLVFLLMLQVVGINLTALAVFGGAVGVGLGFGLQAIASNFISGVIILLDRSVSVDDYIELEDGRTGKVTELNMRSTTLETFDGKDIVVPNEQFITSSFTNWTHKNKKQRYRVDFSVSYKTDVREMVALIKRTVASHPQVLSGEEYPSDEQPDCEIDSFGDSGVNMFVEFWMEGIDDGENRVGGDLLLLILETLQEQGIEIPYPQREVRLMNSNPSTDAD